MSRLEALNLRVDQRHRPLLPATSLSVETGELLLVYGDPGDAHTALALALAGRLPMDEGVVDLDGETDPRLLQQAVALVDVPDVSAPDGSLPVATVAGEELAMARERAGRRDVRDWLTRYGLGHRLDSRIDDLTAPERVRMLSLLAAHRPGALFLVLTLPERNGHLGDQWVQGAEQLTDAGFGLVVTTSVGVAHRIGRDHPEVRMGRLGNVELDEESATRADLLAGSPPDAGTMSGATGGQG